MLHQTTSLCATCKRSVPAELHEEGGQIVMRKRCPEHGGAEVLISSDAAWYHRVMAQAASLEPPAAAREVAQGCPFDCGPCAAHEQKLHLPVVPITSACNLDCPICYTHNKNDGAYHMGLDELDAVLATAAERAPDRRIVNLTGGEPTLHPEFEAVLERCAAAGIHRITVSTHGLTLLNNRRLVARLAELGARVILSFDSFDESINEVMLGGRVGAGKLKVLELLAEHDVDTTLLPVIGRGLNAGELGVLVELALSRDFIRSLEIHPLAFTGQSGADFDRAARYTTYDVLADLESQTGGQLAIDDFVPHPLAHSLCYLVTYVLRIDGDRWLPFPRFMDPADLRALLSSGLYIEPTPETEDILQGVINRLWAGDIKCPEADAVLESLASMIREVFAPGLEPAERLRRSERASKAIYVHTHMDEETFDTDRIRACCVGMPAADGTSVPSCAYNILYRERDARFMTRVQPALVQLGAGRR